MTNSSKRFKVDYVIEVFSKIIITTVFMMMEQKRHCSIRYIRLLVHIHTLFLLYLESYPELNDQIEEKLQQFIKEEAKRHKDYTPNLGSMLAYLLVSNKTKLEDLLPMYLQESIDRQVLWIAKSVPELVNPKGDENLNQQRVNLTFKCEETSYHILCFYYFYIKQM